MRAIVAAVAALVAGVVGYSVGAQPVTVAGCYVLDIGAPGDPWPVLVSDSTHNGLCHVRS